MTKSRNKKPRHVTHIWDKSLGAQQYIILRWKQIQVTKVPAQALHITTEYSADINKWMPWARVSDQIQKLKPHTSMKNKLKKFHKLFDVYNTLHKNDGGSAVVISMLPAPPTKPMTLPWQHGFCEGGKKEQYTKPHTEDRKVSYREDWAYDCPCNSGSPLRDAVGSKNRTRPPLELYITWTRTTYCRTVQTYTPHCLQEGHAHNVLVV